MRRETVVTAELAQQAMRFVRLRGTHRSTIGTKKMDRSICFGGHESVQRGNSFNLAICLKAIKAAIHLNGKKRVTFDRAPTHDLVGFDWLVGVRDALQNLGIDLPRFPGTFAFGRSAHLQLTQWVRRCVIQYNII